MAPRKTTTPTEAELEILQVLWHRGPSTVRDVQEILNKTRVTGYTTVLKLLQIMFEKGHVVRDESERSHRYSGAEPREDMQAKLMDNFMERVFGGSSAQLVMSALGSEKTTVKDLEKIRALLSTAREKRRHG